MKLKHSTQCHAYLCKNIINATNNADHTNNMTMKTGKIIFVDPDSEKRKKIWWNWWIKYERDKWRKNFCNSIYTEITRKQQLSHPRRHPSSSLNIHDSNITKQAHDTSGIHSTVDNHSETTFFSMGRTAAPQQQYVSRQTPVSETIFLDLVWQNNLTLNTCILLSTYG